MHILYYNNLAKAVLSHSDNIITAIDRYLAKADEDMEKTLKDEGFANPKETVEQIDSLQEEIKDILHEQTTSTVAALSTSKNWKDAKKKMAKLMNEDDIAEQVEEVIADMYDTEIPELANIYIKDVESDMVVSTIRQRTSAWTSQWSKQLGELMRINTHQQLTDLIQSSIDNGESIAKLTQRIQDGGWRNEYYQAKRVALTEVLRAHSVAREEAIQQSPSTDRKEWRHTGSRHITPRQNHIDMDGQIVPANQPFTMIGKDGGIYYPQMPLDPILPAGECINCHCIHRGLTNDEILGMSLEERQKLQQEIIDNDDKEWEKELNEKNKAKAGIEELFNEMEQSSKKKLPQTEDDEPFDYKKYLIDKKYIASSEYNNKFDALGESKTLTRRVRTQAKKMLRHRDGTWYEDLVFIDTKSNVTMVRNDYNVKREVNPSRKMTKMIKESPDNTIIAIHNHPGSQVPSYSDFYVASERKYKYGLVVCHNGTIYKYSIIGELNRPIAESALDILSKNGYSEDTDKMFKDAGVCLEMI